MNQVHTFSVEVYTFSQHDSAILEACSDQFNMYIKGIQFLLFVTHTYDKNAMYSYNSVYVHGLMMVTMWHCLVTIE